MNLKLFTKVCESFKCFFEFVFGFLDFDSNSAGKALRSQRWSRDVWIWVMWIGVYDLGKCR